MLTGKILKNAVFTTYSKAYRLARGVKMVKISHFKEIRTTLEVF